MSMQTNLNFYVSLLYLTAAIPYAWLGLFAWRKRPAAAVTPFAWAMLGLSIWSFSYSLELFLPSLPLKLLLARVGYFGSLSIPVFLFLFALEYTDKSRLLNRRSRLLLWVIPIISLLLVWSNETHNLVWKGERIAPIYGLTLLTIDYQPAFWFQIVYSNSLAFLAGVLLAVDMLQRSKVYRIQISFIILGILVLVAGNLLYVNKVNPIPDLNITPLLFLPIVTGIAWTIAHYRMLEIIPLEHLTVLKNMKDGVMVANADRRILYVNPLIETLFERQEKDLIGQPLDFISEEYGALLAARLDKLERPTEMRAGSQVFEVTISLLTTQNDPGYLIILHDITERKKSEEALRQRETTMSALNLAAERFLKESTWEHNIPGILEKIGQAVNVSRVYVFMNYSDEKGDIFSSQCYEWAAPGVSPQIQNPALQHIHLSTAGYSRWQENLSKGQSISGVISAFPLVEQELLGAQNILSVAVTPIFVEKRWWGFIGFDDCRTEREWADSDLETLHIMANLFGSSESRASAEQRLIRRQQTLTLLQEIVSEALRARTLRHMAENVVDQLANLIAASECAITLWDEYTQQTFPLASHDGKDTYLSIQPVSNNHTLTELALQMGNTLVMENASASRLLDPETAQLCPFDSLMVLPLTAAKKKLGAIILAFNARHHFQAEEISTCEQAASLIALAFEKFRVMELAQQRALASETLRKAGTAIAETLETDKTVTRILEQLHEVISYDTASVQILKGNELEVIGGSGFADLGAVIGIRFTIPGNNPNTVVIQTGKPYLLPEVSDVYVEFKNPPHNHIHSWLGVPLIFQEQVIGLLAIDSAKENHFTQENISLAAAFASQVAVALKNARTYEEAQTQAITDSLTGIYNRRGLIQIGEFEFTRARRAHHPFCALMLDIDHFKRVNDRYGHATGDQALRGLAKRAQDILRAMDILGRYGGEEFLIFLPETQIEAAQMVAERLRSSLMEDPLPTDAGPLRITVSIGVADMGEFDALENVIERADLALYEAKRAGRNCVRIDKALQAQPQI